MNIAAHAYSTENGAPGNVYAGSNLTVRSIALQPSLPASEASPSSPAGASGYKKRRYAAELTDRHVGAMFSEGGPCEPKDSPASELTSSKQAGLFRLPTCAPPRGDRHTDDIRMPGARRPGQV